MYEYKCSNELCNYTWTINEGDISALYLTCPSCKKGRGLFVKQVKSETAHEDIKTLPVRKPIAEYKEPEAPVEKNAVSEGTDKEAKRTKEQVKGNNDSGKGKKERKQKEVKAEQIKIETTDLPNKSKKRSKKQENVAETQNEIVEDNIFERIKKKRQQEEEFCKNDQEGVDILEISADSIEGIDKRIAEFEEYYYIKVLDKNIQQQGGRYNCIIKYCRR